MMVLHARLPVALLLAICACEPATARPSAGHVAASPAGDGAIANAELRKNLLAAHATYDGAPVTDLRATARCAAIIATVRGSTPVDWKDLGNLAPRRDGDRTAFDIPAGGRHHLLAARTGAIATRITMGLGLFDEECGGA